jgi:hypothetical protein
MESKCCLVCGATIVTVAVNATETNSEEPHTGNGVGMGLGMGPGGFPMASLGANEEHDRHFNEEGNLTAYLDLFGIDFHDILQRFQSSSASNRVISQDYASTLGKVDVDERFTILYNYVIRIGPLKVNSVPANFSPLLVENVMEAPLVIADPVCGESAFVNDEQLKGSIALMERGVVSFASKCKRAKDAGAVAVIVAQTNTKWPFIMADSTGELDGEIIDIPVCMVSQSDGELLFKWVRSKIQGQSSTESSDVKSVKTNIIFKCDELPKDCSVCQDDMVVGDNVLRLACCHTFHSECIMTWLHKNNNCPMCRHEMPSVPGKVETVRAASGDTTTNHRQNYFA